MAALVQRELRAAPARAAATASGRAGTQPAPWPWHAPVDPIDDHASAPRLTFDRQVSPGMIDLPFWSTLMLDSDALQLYINHDQVLADRR